MPSKRLQPHFLQTSPLSHSYGVSIHSPKGYEVSFADTVRFDADVHKVFCALKGWEDKRQYSEFWLVQPVVILKPRRFDVEAVYYAGD